MEAVVEGVWRPYLSEVGDIHEGGGRASLEVAIL